MLVLMRGHGKYELLGETLDDAAGEAFDKVARLLGLGYPGGPIVSIRATKFKIQNAKFKISFPRPVLNSKDYNFSFSGLKTAVLYKVKEFNKKKVKLTNEVINHICYEFQQAVVDVLIEKTMRAVKEYKVKAVLLSGGVSANELLRETLQTRCREMNVSCFVPDLSYTGDNAAMIAAAAYHKIKNSKRKMQNRINRRELYSWKNVEADANLQLV
jgi:N6-L-threonylcarbamoyladenine synthase